MRVLVALPQAPFVTGGAEVMAHGLSEALRHAGHEAETLRLPFWSFYGEPLHDDLMGAAQLDLEALAAHPIDAVIATKFPGWLLRHSNVRIWAAHQFRQAYELFADTLAQRAGGQRDRRMVEEADHQAFIRARRIWAISRTVAARFQTYNGIEASVLYPPVPDQEDFESSGTWEPFFLLPSRISPLKRHELALRALARSPSARLVVVGPGERAHLEELAESLGISGQVTWAGALPRRELRRLYATARAVVFVPQDEDYGYVTAEAMLASRPVLTCSDSAGPTELVEDGVTGRVVEPTPDALGDALNQLASEPQRARRWGEAGRERYLAMDIVWSRVVEELLA